MTRPFRCVICDSLAVVVTTKLAGWQQPVCRVCAELAVVLSLPTISHKMDFDR